MSGGTFFQSTPPGAYTSQRLNLGDQGPDEAYDGRLALDGSNPVAEFQDLSTHIYIREYKGTADINSSSNWSVALINGQGYSAGWWAAGAASGCCTRRRSPGRCSSNESCTAWSLARPRRSRPTTDFLHANYAITEDAAGRLTVGWFTARVASYVRSSTRRAPLVDLADRRAESQPCELPVDQRRRGRWRLRRLSRCLSPEALTGSQIDVAAFGSFAATGLKGLGNLNGDGIGGIGGDPLGYTSCTTVHFGDIDALAEAGCFLRDPRNPSSGAAVIAGEIRLNGLEIIPDAGVEIAIDPRSHTINTTGSVRVVLRAPRLGDITLYHGELHLDLAGSLAGAGQTLFDVSTSKLTSALEGFPIDGNRRSDPARLRRDPDLPDAAAVHGRCHRSSHAAGQQRDRPAALLAAHRGSRPDPWGAGDQAPFDRLHRDRRRVDRSATLNIPAGSPYFGIAVAVRFDHGDFTMGSFDVNVPFPGVPIFTDAYLDGFGGGFDIHPASRRFFGSV